MAKVGPWPGCSLWGLRLQLSRWFGCSNPSREVKQAIVFLIGILVAVGSKEIVTVTMKVSAPKVEAKYVHDAEVGGVSSMPNVDAAEAHLSCSSP